MSGSYRWVVMGLLVACGGTSAGGDTGPGGDSAMMGNDAVTMGSDSSGHDAVTMGTDSSAQDAVSTGTDSSAQDAVAMGNDSSIQDGATGGSIPPGGTSDQVDCNFGDVEPNDTPSEATPLGTAVGTIYVWVSGNNIGGSDTADYFVFNSSSMAGTTFNFDICSSGTGITGLSATLWQVTGGQMVLPPVMTWSGSATCVFSGGTPPTLMPGTEYLFGVFATGAAGMYSA